MGLLADLWYLHREAILRIAGVCMLIAAAAVVIAGARGSADGAYEAGATAGVVFRNLAVPLVVAAIAGYLVRRWYWYDESASWRELTPESVAIAGVLSLALAVIGGGATSESTDRELIEAAITRSLTESDPAFCGELYTQAFMDQLQLGTGVVAKSKCQEDEADPDHSSEADAVSISGVAVAGDRATATALVIGGVMDRTTVELRLIDDGGAWKLDRLQDIDLDRAAFDRELAAKMRSEGFTRDEATCTVEEFHRRFKLAEIERSVLTGVDSGDPDLGLACFTTRTLRDQVAEGATESVRERGVPEAVVDCFGAALRDLPARTLRAVVKDPHGAATQSTIQGLMEGCANSNNPA